MVRPARQDAVYLRLMTTTVLPLTSTSPPTIVCLHGSHYFSSVCNPPSSVCSPPTDIDGLYFEPSLANRIENLELRAWEI